MHTQSHIQNTTPDATAITEVTVMSRTRHLRELACDG